jgi:hypothetical protein
LEDLLSKRLRAIRTENPTILTLGNCPCVGSPPDLGFMNFVAELLWGHNPAMGTKEPERLGKRR